MLQSKETSLNYALKSVCVFSGFIKFWREKKINLYLFCPHGDENCPKLTGVASSQEHNKAAKGVLELQRLKLKVKAERRMKAERSRSSIGGTRPSPFSSPAPGVPLGWWKGKAWTSQGH